jgi:threonine dehydratase
MKTPSVVSLADITAARHRLAHGLRRTPCVIASVVSEIIGAQIWLKRDDLQRTGSFKERGARNALLTLSAEKRTRGVVAASAGNHALGLAYHGAQLGVPVTVVMPVTAPTVKSARCRSLGANVVLHGQSFEEAHAHATALAAATGAALIHPFDDPRVIAGQGTMAFEILEQVPQLDTLVVPVGGGGLLAGVATVVKAMRPEVSIVAVEPMHAAGFAAAARHGAVTPVSLRPTIADGLAVACVGRHTFAAARDLVDRTVTVSEAELGASVAVLARHCGAVVEGAGAAALAAVLSREVDGNRIVVVVGGRNVDPHFHREILAANPEPLLRPRVACAA